MSDTPPDAPPDALDQLLSEACKTVTGETPQLDELFSQLLLVAELRAQVSDRITGPSIILRDRQGQVSVYSVANRFSFGRARERSLTGSHLTVPNPEVSRGTHFEIITEGEEHVLVDESSANGTFVNLRPERITRHYLCDGDMIEAGGFLIVFLRG